MHKSVMEWVARELPLIPNASVCELGSKNDNGSVKPSVLVLKPNTYIGVDIRPGEGVDVVGDVVSGVMKEHYGEFDIVISTETLEHVQSWQLFIQEAKRLCKPGGHILLTCRSPGFVLHEYPGDYWRFTKETLCEAFKDFQLLVLMDDPHSSGVFLHAIKPEGWVEQPVEYLAAYPAL